MSAHIKRKKKRRYVETGTQPQRGPSRIKGAENESGFGKEPHRKRKAWFGPNEKQREMPIQEGGGHFSELKGTEDQKPRHLITEKRG